MFKVGNPMSELLHATEMQRLIPDLTIPGPISMPPFHAPTS